MSGAVLTETVCRDIHSGKLLHRGFRSNTTAKPRPEWTDDKVKPCPERCEGCNIYGCWNNKDKQGV